MDKLILELRNILKSANDISADLMGRDGERLKASLEETLGTLRSLQALVEIYLRTGIPFDSQEYTRVMMGKIKESATTGKIRASFSESLAIALALQKGSLISGDWKNDPLGAWYFRMDAAQRESVIRYRAYIGDPLF